MCGIAGIVSSDQRPVEPDAIKRMCDTIAHRGPDDAGYVYFRTARRSTGAGAYWSAFSDPKFRHLSEHLPAWGGSYFRDEQRSNQFSVALGHRRLSIIDLTHHGHQPMSNSNGRYWVVFNGEIYNYLQLRQQLEVRGHYFRSRSDTEVLLLLWEEYGVDALPMLDGMFAFAIYDTRENRIVLARDRFGVKPLYYAWSQGSLVFASETKAILASRLVAPQIEASALVEYFTFQNQFGSNTLFAGVKSLLPGEFLECSLTPGQMPEPKRYHQSFPVADPSLGEGSHLREQVADAFADAVKRQLVSDVEIGSYLSGGMDSGSIVAIAGRSIPRLLSFTGGFDLTNVNGIEQGFDERRQAEQLAYLMQTEHYDVVLHSGDMPAAMEQISWHMDDPRVGMCHPNWYVAKLASRFVKVCLAGAGGDELFGGYPWRYTRGLNASTFEEFDREYFRYWHRSLTPEELPELLAPEMRQFCGSAHESFQGVLRGAPAYQDELTREENMLQRALYFDFKTFLNGFLVTEDRMSMAHGLETRVPFLDNALVDLAWRIRPSLKVATQALAGHDSSTPLQSADGKLILRQAMESFLPREFTQQRKQGFSPPDENWFRGPSMDYIKSILLDTSTQQRPWFNHRFVRNKLNEHFTGQRNHRLLIWSLLSVEWLQRHYMDSAIPAWRAKSA